MKAEDVMTPQELGEVGHYGNGGEWIAAPIEDDSQKYPDEGRDRENANLPTRYRSNRQSAI